MKYLLLLAALLATLRTPAQLQPGNLPNHNQLAAQMENALTHGLLARWYPLAIDSAYGGYFSTFTFNFKPEGPQDKFIVTQARHTWTTSQAAMLCPHQPQYLQYAAWGFSFLKNVMWDSTYGGFFNLVTRSGQVKATQGAPKDAYGNAFAIYALAAYYKASKNKEALQLAQQAFGWMEKHSHDAVHKGYYMHLQRDGTPIQRPANAPTTSQIGYKDQNSSIHLLEALTALYQVWPDSLVKARLEEMLYLVRDKITHPKGYLVLFFTPGWTPVSFAGQPRAVIMQHKHLDHISFGHDVETAFLLLEATETLGNHHDTLTLRKARHMVDHALHHGWDNSVGGFYDEGYYFNGADTVEILLSTKNWWAQAEGLHTLLLMTTFPGHRSADYYQKFLTQWQYIQTYLLDHQHGDWYEGGLDKQPEKKLAVKGHIWKGNYHTFRALAGCIERLRRKVADE